MTKTRALFFIVIATLVLSCKPTIPSRYIQPDELEDILYDYHLADGMAEDHGYSEDSKYNKELYRQAVLKKHGITQAEFDSTLVYYTRHSDQLHTIYENLVKRFSDEALALGASTNDVNQFGNITSDGDTANIWTGVKSVVLTAEAPYNVMTFNLTADTTYHKGDRILLNFNSDFIFKDGIRDAIVMLSVRFSNDSVTCNTMHISSNSKYNVSVSDKDRLRIKSIRGFFYLPKDIRGGDESTSLDRQALRVLSITNISMVRFHNNEKPATAPTDSAKRPKPDSLRRVGAPNMPAPPPNGRQIKTPDGNAPTPPPNVPPHALPPKKP